MNIKINFPAQSTWFICWNNNRTDLKTYGLVHPNQTMSTKFDVLDTYLVEEEWLEVLKQNGIVEDINNEINDTDFELLASFES